MELLICVNFIKVKRIIQLSCPSACFIAEDIERIFMKYAHADLYSSPKMNGRSNLGLYRLIVTSTLHEGRIDQFYKRIADCTRNQYITQNIGFIKICNLYRKRFSVHWICDEIRRK
jgi:hypothetical protein